MKALQFAATAAVLSILAAPAMAQEQATTASSGGSLRPIPQADQMFRKTIWRTIDLREKQNQPMFSSGKEITKVIIEAVKRGELQAYKNDSLTSTFTPQEMKANTSYEEEVGDVPDDAGWGAPAKASAKPAPANDGWGAPAASAPTASKKVKRAKKDRNGKVMKDKRGNVIYETVTVASAPVAPPAPTVNLQPYRYQDLFQMDLVENMVFDKKRSRMYHEIQSITLNVPASKNKKSVDLPIATFKYKDLVKVFRNNPQTAIWFNSQNDAQHKNLADAFELWMFSSYITRVSNPANADLAETYGSQRQGILAAQQTASDLVEYEYNLWSF
jgi:gliding motility associated protien GldN